MLEIYLMCLTRLPPGEVASRKQEDVVDGMISIDD